MKKLHTFAAVVIILAGILGWDFVAVQAATPPLTSSQISSTTATNGFVLQTDGANGNHWVATSTLGISGAVSTNYLTNVGSNTFLNTGTFLQAPAVNATSTLATSTISNLGGVLDPSAYTGADIGAKSNTAYAALPTTGGRIQPENGTQQYATGIAFNTNNKFARLYCGSGGGSANNADGGTTLFYTGTTGTSTAFNTNNYITAGASGIENCDIQGTNGTTARITDGVFFGGTNGAFGADLDHVNVSGFGTGLSLRPSTSFNTVLNSVIHFNGRNISEPDTSGANCENMRILNSVIADSNNAAGGATDLKGMYVQESGNCQWNIGYTSFDDNQIYADQFGGQANIWNIGFSHFENSNNDVYPMFASQSGASQLVANFIGTDMMNDTVAGQPDQIEATGVVNLIGFTSDANSNVTTRVTRIINPLASSTQITAVGLVCKGANASSFLYKDVPCGPLVVGADYAEPSLFVASTTSVTPGFVGIATGTPSTALSVAGVIYSGTGGFKFPDGTTQTTAAVGSTNYWTLTGNNLFNNSGTNVGIGTGTPPAVLTVNATSAQLVSSNPVFLLSTSTLISGSGNGTYIAVNSPSGFSGDFLNFQKNGSPAFRVDSSGKLIESGDASFEVGNTFINTELPSSNNQGTIGNISTFYNHIYTTFASTTVLSATTVCLSTDCRTAWPAASTFTYPFTNPTEFATVTAATSTPIWAQEGVYASSTSYIASTTFLINGNVGVGSTSPNSKLVVSGKLSIDNGSASEIDFGGGTSANVAYGGTTATNGDLDFTSPNSFRLIGAGGAAIFLQNSVKAQFGGTFESGGLFYINNSGNVGIDGTTTPGSLLSVGTASNTTGINFGLATSTFTNVGGINITTGCYAVNNVCLSTSGTNYFTNSGSQTSLSTGTLLGIGTTTPNWTLQVAGTHGNFALTDNSAATNLKHWLFTSEGGNLYVGSTTDLYATSTPAALTILNNGNIGLGSSSPSAMLSIASGLTVTGTNSGIAAIQEPMTSQAGAREILQKDSVSDSGNDALYTMNGTATDGSFGPQFAGIEDTSSSRASLTFRGWVTSANDTGTAPLLNFDSQESSSAATPQSASYSAITTRPLVDFENNDVSQLRLFANGSVGLGSSTPFATLSVNPTAGQASNRFAVGSSTGTSLIVNNNGNVGVGTTTAASTFTVNGGVTLHGLAAGAGAGSVCATADGLLSNDVGAACIVSTRLAKHDISPITGIQADEVLQLTPVQYTYNDGSGTRYGFIAEDVAKIDPKLVVYAATDTPVTGIDGNPVVVKKGQPLTVDYARYVGLLTAEVQLQEKQIQTLGGGKQVRSMEENWQDILIILLIISLAGYVTYNENKRK